MVAPSARTPSASAPQRRKVTGPTTSSRPSFATSVASSRSSMAPPQTNVASGTSSRLTAPTIASAARRVVTKSNASMISASSTASKAKARVKPPTAPASAPRSNSAQPHQSSLEIQESIKAYLRIRPAPEDASREQSEPYISVVNDQDVLMTPPTGDTGLARARTHAKLPSTKYTFARVFGPHDAPSNSQSSFFQETTLPMVEGLLQGDSGLIFTYGVTNSGKSYTVSGGNEMDEAGLLPRALDVAFNSIEGLQSKSSIAPVGLYGVERCMPPSPNAHASSSARPSLDPWSVPGVKKRLTETGKRSTPPLVYHRDQTTLKVDRNYRYSIWVSYVEVYNEKLFDLLDANAPVGGGSSPGPMGGMTRSDSIRGSNWSIAGLASSANLADLANGPITLARKPLSLKTDPEGGGKYVSGLREIRVSSIEEARELVQRGQENRVVFATMANRASSRSHGVFTIKLLKEHAGDADDTLACTVSRLSIVDLAGSERISNTSTSGQRQKEAGSINKSLMCLGQCLDTLRKNQARAASMIPTLLPIASAQVGGSATDTPPTAKAAARIRRPSVVPFRHSKLTELFQPFFTGEGRTIMIVNANPYDTGFDENSHVMKFSAIAKEVQIQHSQTGSGARSQVIHRIKGAGPVPFPSLTDGESDVGTPPGTPSRQAISRGNRGRVHHLSTASVASSRRPTDLGQEITIIEESGDEDDDDDDDPDDDAESGGDGAFIDALIARHEELRERLYEAEMRCAMIESEVREELAVEMAEKLIEMESKYTERILGEVERNEEFFNRKIDLLVSSSSSGTRSRSSSPDRHDYRTMETPRASRLAHQHLASDETYYSEDASTDGEDELDGPQADVDDSLVTANESSTSADPLDLSLRPGPIVRLRGRSPSDERDAEEEQEDEDSLSGSTAAVEEDVETRQIALEASQRRSESRTADLSRDSEDSMDSSSSLTEAEDASRLIVGDESEQSGHIAVEDESHDANEDEEEEDEDDESDEEDEEEDEDDEDESFQEEASDESEEEEEESPPRRSASRRRSTAAASPRKSLANAAKTASATGAASRRSTTALMTKPLGPSSGRVSNTKAGGKPRATQSKASDSQIKAAHLDESDSDSEADLFVPTKAANASPERAISSATEQAPGSAKPKTRVRLGGGRRGSAAAASPQQKRLVGNQTPAKTVNAGMLDRQTQRRLLADAGVDTSSYDLDVDDLM
ncbi:unnamed protein product [Parajaminaea phylloscopi]